MSWIGPGFARLALVWTAVLSVAYKTHTFGHTSFALADRALHTALCSPVTWNRASVPGHCSVLESVCVDQGSRIVTHHETFQIENVRRANTPSLPSTQWNLPLRVSSFPDALGGWQPDFQVAVRPASKAEPTLALRHPSFSNCTLPVVLLVDYPYNLKTFMVKALTDVDAMFRDTGLTPNKDATLVLATPSGLALEPYHAVLLSPYSRRPLITLAELGRRGMEGLPADWAAEGVRQHCFSSLIACKLDQMSSRPPDVAAAAVLAHLGPGSVPADPLGFAAASAPATNPPAAAPLVVLRVLVEQRTAGWRTIRNVDEILRACEQANAAGFSAGAFNRIVCKPLPAGYDTSRPEPGSIPPDSPATSSFRTTIGAVRSAHLLVAMVGAIGGHAFFMSPGGPLGAEGGGAGAADGHGVGAGVLEVRPCGWGSTYAGLADGSKDALARQLPAGDDAIRFFAYNVEEAPLQCQPPDYSQQAQAAMGAMRLAATVHDSQPKSRPRYKPEELLVRDQHVTLRTATLLAMIRHAAALLGDKGAYRAARDAGRLHGYAVAEGLLLGPLGLQDAARKAREGPPELIRVS